MSKNTIGQNSFASRVLFNIIIIIIITRWHCWIVEWYRLQLNWWSGSNSSRMLLFFNLAVSSFSSILEFIGKRLIGWYDVTSCGGLSGFWTSIIWPSLSCKGQYFNLRMALYRCTKNLIPSFGSSYSTLSFISSKPGVSLYLISVCCWASVNVKFLIGMDICRGESRWVSISGSWTSEWGLNSSLKCWANSCAFSWSDRAHHLSVFL